MIAWNPGGPTFAAITISAVDYTLGEFSGDLADLTDSEDSILQSYRAFIASYFPEQGAQFDETADPDEQAAIFATTHTIQFTRRSGAGCEQFTVTLLFNDTLNAVAYTDPAPSFTACE